MTSRASKAHDDDAAPLDDAAPASVTFAQALRVWARIGMLSFGGPAGQIALMHRELVERRKWIDEERFLHALNYCMLLPGPEAQQLATYIGWLLHRTRGGVAAGLLFVLPGFVAILALSILYASFQELPLVAAVFYGLKAAVTAVVIEAVVRVGKRALKTRALVALAIGAFLAIFCFDVPFPVIVLGAGAVGWLGASLAPGAFPAAGHGGAEARGTSLLSAMEARGELAHIAPSLGRSARVLGVCLTLWALPFVVLLGLVGARSVFFDEAVFFSESAMVTFGGAYAVLSFVAQRAVSTYGWLRPGEMLDGLGLAETTPGPLIMVVQFVGFMGAYRSPEGLPPLLAGVLGSTLTVWVTFVPCFLWIFLGAPYLELLRKARRLAGALSAITASVVGVILNLSLWFGLHVAFGTVTERHVGVVRLVVPSWATADPVAIALAALAFVALTRLKISLPKVLLAAAILGAGARLAFPAAV